MSRPFPDEEGETLTRTKSEKKLKRPPLFKVLLHNDDYTTREFVVAVLVGVFRKSEADAVAIMLHVHHHGMGVAGVYPHDVAETKVARVTELAQEARYPLLCTMEPEA